MFWSIKNSSEVLNKLKSRGFRATNLSTYDFSTLYTTLPHKLINEKLINLIEWTFKREGSHYIACNERQAFFTSEDTKRYKLWSCQNVCEALMYLLNNINIRFGSKLYRQIVGIPMGTNCAPLVADLFLFCYERDFLTSLSDVKQAEIIEAFKSTSRYLNDLFNIDNPYFEGMVNRIYPPELQLYKANTSDIEAPFLDLSISNGFVSSKIYDKRDDFDFDIVNFLFLDGDLPVLPLTGFTFLNLFGLLECLVMWLIPMPVIKVYLPNFSNRAVGIINFERLSPNFIADTMNWFLNSMLD